MLALTPFVSVPMGVAAFAATSGTTSTITTTTPAPPGDASAVAVEIDGVLAVGKTTAHAGPGSASSSADSLDLLGTQVAGGTDNSSPSSGSLVGTGSTPLGDAEVAPWSAQAHGGADKSTAQAEAALAHVNLADAVELWLLHSQSQATWTPDKSTGDSSSDGAEVSALGQLDIKVLHSEAHSGATGKSDLVVINGNEIGSNQQANGMCEIPADPLLHLLCLTADGGTSANGVTTSDGNVVSVSIGGGQLTGTVSNSSTKGGIAQTPTATKHAGGSTAAGRTTNGSRLPHTTGPAAAGLPFTGSDAGRLAALGLAFAALGSAMVAFARRTRGLLAF